MRKVSTGWLVAALATALPAFAQDAGIRVTRDDQSVGRTTPEAWAMRYLAGTTLLTSQGELPKLAPWRWAVAGDLGHIPRLDEEQRTVGLGGIKTEDLNKSPVFGRVRGAVGLPGDWVAEIGWTPPLELRGSKARNFFAGSIGRRFVDADGFSLSARALGQVGEVRGDITCPARVAGSPDPAENPYDCRAPSNDVFSVNYLGVDATAAWRRGDWSWHASMGLVKTRLTAQVDALVSGVNERTKLTSADPLGYLAAGARYAIDRNWSLGAELLYVPLEVARPPSTSKERDSLASVRAQLRYAFD
jgi:opacity protein-like surface antigen